jgi:hypothetical protein
MYISICVYTVFLKNQRDGDPVPVPSVSVNGFEMNHNLPSFSSREIACLPACLPASSSAGPEQNRAGMSSPLGLVRLC